MIQIIIDVEAELTHIEDIIKNYINVEYDSDFTFVPGFRDPFCTLTPEQKSSIFLKQLSNVPYHPYLSAYIVRNMLLRVALDYAVNKSEFMNNSVLKNRDPIYSDIYKSGDEWHELEELVTNILPIIVAKDLKHILWIFDAHILPKFCSLFESNPDTIWDIDISKPYINISGTTTILEYRYSEILKAYNGK